MVGAYVGVYILMLGRRTFGICLNRGAICSLACSALPSSGVLIRPLYGRGNRFIPLLLDVRTELRDGRNSSAIAFGKNRISVRHAGNPAGRREISASVIFRSLSFCFVNRRDPQPCLLAAFGCFFEKKPALASSSGRVARDPQIVRVPWGRRCKGFWLIVFRNRGPRSPVFAGLLARTAPGVSIPEMGGTILAEAFCRHGRGRYGIDWRRGAGPVFWFGVVVSMTSLFAPRNGQGFRSSR